MQYGGRPCKHKNAPHEVEQSMELSDSKDMVAVWVRMLPSSQKTLLGILCEVLIFLSHVRVGLMSFYLIKEHSLQPFFSSSLLPNERVSE